MLSYRLPVPDGTYTIRLHFADPYAPAGARLMDVVLNGTVVRSNFDITTAAGGTLKATTLSFPVTASAGKGVAPAHQEIGSPRQLAYRAAGPTRTHYGRWQSPAKCAGRELAPREAACLT